MLEMLDRLVTPDLKVGPVSVKVSVSAILEDANGRLLLIKEVDGYSPPAGRCDEYEHFYPKSALFRELHEETNIYSFSFDDMKLWGKIISLKGKLLSVGLVYKLAKYKLPEKEFRHIVDDDVIELGFFDRQQVQNLLKEGNIRKEKWNRPVLESWLQNKKSFFLFK